ncbi:MAG: hypothetical protein R3242_01525 [Akkermansiaceae bacterium]|nr:hypothetical protein [Akkermansiaceae bacterium]
MLLGSYPCLVLGYVWFKVAQSDLPGGRNGPLDAYRHTLASAVVAHTLNEDVVKWVTEIMEDDQFPTQRMDIHNNRIGAQIGARTKRFRDLEPAVAKSVANGRIMANDPEQSTWMPEFIWGDSRMW